VPARRIKAAAAFNAVCIHAASGATMDWEILKDFIKPELLVLIPVLYLIGIGMKKSEKVDDRFIPILLGISGIILSMLYVGATSAISSVQDILNLAFVSITQGILTGGASVYVNQIYKQLTDR
jgi:hypothetical protein